MCAELYSGSLSPSCKLCKFSHLNTRTELAHQTQQHVWNTSSFFQHGIFTKSLYTRLSRLLVPQVFLLLATNTTNELKPANWTSAKTPLVHKHSVVLAALFTDQATISDKVDLGRNLTLPVKETEHTPWHTRSWYSLHDISLIILFISAWFIAGLFFVLLVCYVLTTFLNWLPY